MLMTEDGGLNKAYCMDRFSSQTSEGDANIYQMPYVSNTRCLYC